MDDKLPSGDPGAGYQGTVGRTLQESSPWWPPRPEARAGSPDIVVVLLDDLGFSDVGCFGAEIATPNIDALAANGLRFSQYTTVPMCTPARAALLTGKNPHAVGCGWLTFNLPGYPGYQAGEISRDAPTLAELLRGSGYATYCAGKWHNTADFDVSASASRASWPLARGFDRFYGFIGGETHYFSPFQLFEDNAIVDRDAYASDYYCTDDWTDKAVAWLTSHVSSSRDKPFFLYLPYNAPHAPLQAKPSDLVRYRGVYDRGWDELRDARRERQQAMRLFAREWPVAPRSPGVPAWAELPAERRALYARYMELYAAIVDNVDQNVGRVVACLQKLGRLDNTLVIVTSDNGANGIGGVEGAVNNLAKRLTGREDPERVRDVMASGRLGATETWPAYPLGWTDVSSAPFRLYKTTTMNGGIRVPFVAHWPRGIAERGAIRQQWLHVTDIVPTILDIVGQPYPEALNGYRTRSLDGVSAKALFRRANATSARSRQHYELAGNRGYIENGWKIVSLQPPGRAIDLDNWMLFDLECDATEVHDLARAHPDKLAELVAAFDADAQANYVYPLDNRGVRRSLTVPPFLEGAYARPHTFHPGSTIALGVVAPLVNDRDYRLACTFEFEPGDEGVLFALGDLLGGLALFARGDALVFVYRSGQGGEVASDALRVRAGTNRFELRHEALGARRGRGTLVVNDERVATVDMSPTTILGLGVGEGLDIGVDRKLPVTERYEGNGAWPYTGRVACVTIEPGTHPADSYANLPEREAQRQP